MKLQDFMDRAGIHHTRLAVEYIKDGVREMQLITDEYHERVYQSLQKDRRTYELPEQLTSMKAVRILDEDSGKYIKIPRIIGDISDEATLDG